MPRTQKRAKRQRRKSNTKKSPVFTKEDFNSNDGMLTSVWGPAIWHVLHTISFNYKVHPSEEEKAQYKTFIESLQNVLPCRACRENLKKNLPLAGYGDHVYENRETFSRFIFDLHQTVNKMLGKENDLTYEKVRDIYENFRARCGLKIDENDDSNTINQKCSIEAGCTVPITGIKSKCILRIVPFIRDDVTFEVDKKCICKREEIGGKCK